MIAVFAHAALTISAAVVGSLWEGVPIVAAVWLALRFLPNLGAATRYAVWLCALAALLAVPVITVWASAPHAATSAPVETRQAVASPPLAPSAPQPKTNLVVTGPHSSVVSEVETPTIPAARPASAVRIDVPQGVAIAIAIVWILAAGTRALVLLQDLRELAALRRAAERWSSSGGYPIFLSHNIRVPLAAGFLHPAVILPAPLSEELPQKAVTAIVAHEVAHLRRLDVWTNAFARVIEIFVVLNPLAWFVVRRLSIEREIACDDWVVARSGGGEIFARTLATLASRACARTPLAAPSALGSRHAVVERIERLLEAGPRRLRPSLSALGGVLIFIAMAAFVLQSVSPVFAYAPQTVTLTAQSGAQVAATCPAANRGIQLSSSMGFRMGAGPPPVWYAAEDAAKIVARFTAANVAVVDLTVDASGTPRVAVVSTPPYPGMAEYVKNIFTHDTYEPALKNCVAVTSTIRTGLRVEKPQANSLSTVAPSYPDGWSAQHPTACKIPNLLHTGVPAFPRSVTDFSVMNKAKASARVTVDASGRVTNATILASSGQPAFDDALLQAARSATYPLMESTGFKPVRPNDATLAWNAANGSAVYSKCTPKPSEYVWNTTFKPIVPIGAPGSSLDMVVMGMNF